MSPATQPARRARRLTPQLHLRREQWLCEFEREVYLSVRDLLSSRGSRDPHGIALRCAHASAFSADRGLRIDEIAGRLGVSVAQVKLDRRLVEDALAEGALGA